MSVAYAAYIAGTASANTSSAAVNFTGRSVGDLAFVLISRGGAGSPNSVPSNWNLLQNHSSGNAAFLYCKQLEAGDIGTVTWTWVSAGRTFAHGLVYTGHDTTTPIAQSNKSTYETALGSTCNCGLLTSTNPMLVQFCTVSSTTVRSYNAKAGYTERLDNGSTTPDFWHLLADTDGTWVSGDSDPAFDLSATASYRGGFQVDINPATSAATYSGRGVGRGIGRGIMRAVTRQWKQRPSGIVVPTWEAVI